MLEQLKKLVNELRVFPNETEWFEFKVNSSDPESIGEYISALSNSASLIVKNEAYLIFGIDNDTHEVVGTKFQPKKVKKGNEELENRNWN